MKILSILFMLFGVFLVLAFGFMYLLGFAMSFDAPDSGNLTAWLYRFLFFAPLVILIVALVFALQAYTRGNYGRSMRIGLVFVLSGIGSLAYLFGSSLFSLREYRKGVEQEEEYARLYPKQKFVRQVGEIADTIIVWPNKIVAYRYNSAPNFPLSGPLGDLNESRDTIVYNRSPHNDISMEVLGEFVDEQGRKLTDVYRVR